MVDPRGFHVIVGALQGEGDIVSQQSVGLKKLPGGRKAPTFSVDIGQGYMSLCRR
jgi:hypothetical protein